MDDVSTGTPAAVFLPAREHKFRFRTEVIGTSVPVRGEADPGLGGGPYDVCPEPGVFLFGDLLKALFTHGGYPNLEDKQLFVLSGVALEGGTLQVAGRIIELVED